MNRELTPESAGPPSANYALAMVTERPQRLLHTSGIGPVLPDGSVPDGLDRQADAVWATLGLILEDAGLRPDDVVSVVTYVVIGNDLGPVMAARDRALGGHRCASTLVPVPALATPSWKMEVAIVAAGRDRSNDERSNDERPNLGRDQAR